MRLDNGSHLITGDFSVVVWMVRVENNEQILHFAFEILKQHLKLFRGVGLARNKLREVSKVEYKIPFIEQPFDAV